MFFFLERVGKGALYLGAAGLFSMALPGMLVGSGLGALGGLLYHILSKSDYSK